MIKVCKFGGTSMSTASAIKSVARIVNSDDSRKFVVVSAPGKRSKEDVKITDLLYDCANLACKGKSIVKSFSLVRARFNEIVCDLGIDLDIGKYLDEVESGILSSGGDADFAASRGEYLGGIVMAAVLEVPFIDAAKIIKFNERGEFDGEYTNDLACKILKKYDRAVIPGFYGSMPFDKIKTFSRGGSDITGSIIARGARASVYENWTDVNGFLSADPRIVDNPRAIKCLSYRELRELSYMGANVLHAEAIFPVKYANIPINIRNTFDPQNSGTMIVPNEDFVPSGDRITGIAGKKDYVILYIEKSMMNAEVGFGRKVLTILERYGVTFEHIPSGIDTLSVVVSSSDIASKEEKIIEKIRDAVSPDDIALVHDIALIATVGHGMSSRIGTAARLCGAIAKADVNLRMIDQGSSEMNIIIAVKNDDYEKAVRAIYDEFFA